MQIIEAFSAWDYHTMPAVLVACHGPFTWGATPQDAVKNSSMLEYVAEMNSLSLLADPNLQSIKRPLLDKHYLRKHGRGAYYGQGKGRVL